jgi:hypothetical protein
MWLVPAAIPAIARTASATTQTAGMNFLEADGLNTTILLD